MASHRRRDLLARRRRVDDEGEDEGCLDNGELEDDSLSDTSANSDLLDEEDGDADTGETNEDMEVNDPSSSSQKPVANGHLPTEEGRLAQQGDMSVDRHQAKAETGRTDTDVMLNGMEVPRGVAEADEVAFEDMGKVNVEQQTAQRAHMNQVAGSAADTPLERRRREQEEYRKKRDADPSFVPNRGGFFMHDHRHAGPASNGFRPFGRGRGRGGRGGASGGPFPAGSHMSLPTEAVDAPWAHDLHEATVAGPPPPTLQGASGRHGGVSRPMGPPPAKEGSPLRSFSKSTHTGNTQVRVFICGMSQPVTFAAVPVHQHTRLPHHRPPLRRDKPVRISLPEASPRFVFPSKERSFIFIPRAQRPHQTTYGRRADLRALSTGPNRGFGSGRTSAYAGSSYSSSVAMSRRSSLAHEIQRESLVSPSGSTLSRGPAAASLPNKPVVRLPPSTQARRPTPQAPLAMRPSQPMPIVNLPYQRPIHAAPQDPTLRENRATPIPMHQPRPQKNVSVADIETPETTSYHPPPPQQQVRQPFHQQIPNSINGPSYFQDAPYPVHTPHSRQPSYPSQHSSGTPLSGIPERAIHAQPFMPQPYQQQAFYPAPYGMLSAPGTYYFPSHGPAMPSYALAPSVVTAPAFIPGASQIPYSMMPLPPAAAVPTQGSTMAQESNGMVYYYDSSQMPPPPATNGYHATAYPTGPLAMGHSLMTPSPDGYYYPPSAAGPVYYTQ